MVTQRIKGIWTGNASLPTALEEQVAHENKRKHQLFEAVEELKEKLKEANVE